MDESILAVPAKASRLKYFLALSRTPHGLLDMAAPVFAALLALGRFPPLATSLVGLVTVFAGYTAVYAVNDIVDYRTDRANFHAERSDQEGYLDALFLRHPLAQGVISRREALAWAAFWGALGFAGALWLNPVCALVLLLGCLLEAIYCLLLKVTHLRALVNGVVKTLGGLAAMLAVDPDPQGAYLALYFISVAAWEIGGQNIPADWFDLDLDRGQGARTIPLMLGPSEASALAVACLSMTTAGSALLFAFSPGGMNATVAVVAPLACGVILLRPALALRERQDRDAAARLFNRASLYPVMMLVLALFSLSVN